MLCNYRDKLGNVVVDPKWWSKRPWGGHCEQLEMFRISNSFGTSTDSFGLFHLKDKDAYEKFKIAYTESVGAEFKNTFCDDSRTVIGRLGETTAIALYFDVIGYVLN